MQVYTRETDEIVLRFLQKQIGFAECISALDAALAGFIPTMRPDQIDEQRAATLANHDIVTNEVQRRGSVASTEPFVVLLCRRANRRG
jgi:hypothetical protein